jgi:hypothetical protein
MVFIEVDGCMGRTSVVDQNLNPIWNDPNQTFEFQSLDLQVLIDLELAQCAILSLFLVFEVLYIHILKIIKVLVHV